MDINVNKDFNSGRFVDIAEYGVFYYIDVVDPETGDTIDYFNDEEFFQNKDDADRYASELRSQVGEVVCSWGRSIGILREVLVDDEPRINQYYATPHAR